MKIFKKNISKNIVARSIINFTVVGGLLFLFSLLLSYVWNNTHTVVSIMGSLNSLETFGIILFNLLIYMAIKTGFSKKDKLSEQKFFRQKSIANMSDYCDNFLQSLTDEEKQKYAQKILNSIIMQDNNPQKTKLSRKKM